MRFPHFRRIFSNALVPPALTEPITLRDGRELETLADAGALILGLSERSQARPPVAYAGELLLRAAAEDASDADILDAWAQVRRALSGEGLLMPA